MRPAARLLLGLTLSAAAVLPAQWPPSSGTSSSGLPTQGAPRGALRIDTVWSQSLGISKRLYVYLPPSYTRDTLRRHPVLFYLHGVGGDEENWVRLARLDRVMDSLVAAGHGDAIVAMPDGDDSWYTTWHTLPDLAACRADTARIESPATYCVPWPHYDDYIARDLVAHVDSAYRTRAAARHRGIAGLSMGGYGAVTLALRYPDVFSAAASHSGVLAPALLGPRPFAEPAIWARTPAELREAAGDARYDRWFAPRFGRDTIGWYARDPGRLARRLLDARADAGGQGPPLPVLRFDTGRDDPYRDQNRAFAATLRALGWSYEYAEPAGGHTWDYWRAQLPGSLAWLLRQVHDEAEVAPSPARPSPNRS
jgi:S-formylglutathione hydrolase FrmB